MLNAITIDVEDYFHPSEVQASVSPGRWDSMTSRVERSTDRCLDLLGRHQTKGTFFILGWAARKSPELVRRIAEAGHEIACHSFWHRLVYDLTPDQFRQNTVDASRALTTANGHSTHERGSGSRTLLPTCNIFSWQIRNPNHSTLKFDFST